MNANVGREFLSVMGRCARRCLRWRWAVGAWLLVPGLLQAQSPSVDGFNPDLLPFNQSGSVFAMLVQPDGKVVVGGDFVSGVRRFHPDGSWDSSFNPYVNGPVFSLALQADGKIVAGGSFDAVASQTRSNLVRLNANGTVDTSFTPAVIGADFAVVYSLAVQSDGKILVGGGFDRLAGTGAGEFRAAGYKWCD